MNYENAKSIAKAIGFTHFIKCEGSISILDPYRSIAKVMSGCYLQFRAEDVLYIGQSTNIPNRFQAHRSHGHDIHYLAFRTCPREMLRELEADMIDRAERLGYRLANRKVAKVTTTPQLFDEVVSPAEQDAFIARFDDQAPFQKQMLRVVEEAGDSHRADWLAFKRQPKAADIISVTAHYLRTVLPAPDLAGTFYRVTLGQRRNETVFIPDLRLTFGVHTLYTVGHLRIAPNAPYVSVTFATEALLMGDSKETFEEEFNWLSVRWDVLQTDLPYSPTHRKVYFPSPQAMEEDAAREINGVLAQGMTEITVPLDMLPDLLREPRFAKAAAMAAIACMRWSPPVQDEHNRIASFALEIGLMP